VLRNTVITFVVLGSLSLAQTSTGPCDPLLKNKEDKQNPNGYRSRGDRCEGVFVKDVVGGGSILLASYSSTLEGLDPEYGKTVEIEWRALGNGPLHIRAYSMRRRLYYQMDTIQPSSSMVYVWPSDILASYSLRPPDLGIVGWTSYSVGNRDKEVYVPLAVRRHKSDPFGDSYELVLWSPVDITEVYVTIAQLGKSGQSQNVVKDGVPLHYGYYPAERGISVPLPQGLKSGIYFIEIGADIQNGGSAASQFWIYCP
jgi:hypothetical protein